eukprot:108726-Prymnesium_polylepis.1
MSQGGIDVTFIQALQVPLLPPGRLDLVDDGGQLLLLVGTALHREVRTEFDVVAEVFRGVARSLRRMKPLADAGGMVDEPTHALIGDGQVRVRHLGRARCHLRRRHRLYTLPPLHFPCRLLLRDPRLLPKGGDGTCLPRPLPRLLRPLLRRRQWRLHHRHHPRPRGGGRGRRERREHLGVAAHVLAHIDVGAGVGAADHAQAQSEHALRRPPKREGEGAHTPLPPSHHALVVGHKVLRLDRDRARLALDLYTAPPLLRTRHLEPTPPVELGPQLQPSHSHGGHARAHAQLFHPHRFAAHSERRHRVLHKVEKAAFNSPMMQEGDQPGGRGRALTCE